MLAHGHPEIDFGVSFGYRFRYRLRAHGGIHFCERTFMASGSMLPTVERMRLI